MANFSDEVVSAAAAGALVLTANKRLFRALRAEFDQQMIAAGKQVWSTPQIFSFDGWLKKCLDDLGDGWRLISSHQQQWLWEGEIAASCRDTELELLQETKTAEKAIQADRLLSEYDIDLDSVYLNADQQQFCHWQQRVRSRCRGRDWLLPGELPRHICTALANGRLEIPAVLLLIGFDQLPPGIELLKDVVAAGGGRCCDVALDTGTAGTMVRFAAADKETEIEMAARWTRYHLEAGATSIGLVVPDLQVRRRQLEQVFRDQIDPEGALTLADEDSLFGLSLGAPLAEQGVIHAALELLSARVRLSLDQVSFLLRTPYLGGAEREGDSRAVFERRLRSYRQPSFTLSHLIGMTRDSDDLALFHAILKQLQQFIQQPERALPGDWARRFADHLHLLGWPGERSLASREYQALHVWQEKGLAALVALDALQQPTGRSRALQFLRRSCQEIEFQIESAPGPVQVVGLLEAAGLHFDHLWVMGLGESVLPARSQPNPFIPLKLQRQFEMPHASAERELKFAEQVMDRLQAASPDIVFSYPTQDGDTRLRPSPLIPSAARLVSDLTIAPRRDAFSLLAGAGLFSEDCVDDHGPAVTAGQVGGGTQLLQDQAHCPFRAFVRHRLQGEKLASGAPGVDPLARGHLLHLALEKIWRQLVTRDNLCQLDGEKRRRLLETHVAATLDSYYSTRTAPVERLLKLEAERMVVLLEEWLDKESEREPFTVVETEKLHVEQIGPLQIRLKVDRIDELNDGRRIVIDYKTGHSVEPKNFLTRPLIEPQLPVYAVADGGETVDALVFARLRRGESKFAGMGAEDKLIAGVKGFKKYPQTHDFDIDNWSDLIDFWRTELDRLGCDFAAGKAAVHPYDRKKSCEYCDFIGLCRVTEAADLTGDES